VSRRRRTKRAKLTIRTCQGKIPAIMLLGMSPSTQPIGLTKSGTQLSIQAPARSQNFSLYVDRGSCEFLPLLCSWSSLQVHYKEQQSRGDLVSQSCAFVKAADDGRLRRPRVSPWKTTMAPATTMLVITIGNCLWLFLVNSRWLAYHSGSGTMIPDNIRGSYN
jgi:hypothetical protein